MPARCTTFVLSDLTDTDVPLSERTVHCRQLAADAGRYAASVEGESAKQAFGQIAKHWAELADWMEGDSRGGRSHPEVMGMEN